MNIVNHPKHETEVSGLSKEQAGWCLKYTFKDITNVTVQCHVSLTCCRLRDVHLGGLLLLGQECRHTAQLREAAAATAAAGGQTATLQLLGLHLTDVRGVRGCGGLGAE